MQLTKISEPHLMGRCMFIYDGPASLYLTSKSCLLSRIVYPDHFSNAVEAGALDTNIYNATAHVLAAHPGVIITSNMFVIPQVNKRTYAMVLAAIRQNYTLAGKVKAPDRTFSVWGWHGRDYRPTTLPTSQSNPV